MAYIKDNLYIAKYNNKYGILDTNNNLLVAFDYDLITYIKDYDYYIVSKNNKLAIMNINYKMITGFDYDYHGDYSNSARMDNTYFTSYKYVDKYIIDSNYSYQTDIDERTEDKSDIYIINSNGTLFKKLSVSRFGIDGDFIYSSDCNTKMITVYNSDFSIKFTISPNTTTNELIVSKVDKYLVVDNEKVYNANIGNEVLPYDVEFTLKYGDIELVYEPENGNERIDIKENGQLIDTYHYSILNGKPFIEGNDYYLASDNTDNKSIYIYKI